MVEILIFLIYTEQRKLLSVWFFKFFFSCCLFEESRSSCPSIGFCFAGKALGAALVNTVGLPLSWTPPPRLINNHKLAF